MKNTLLCPLHKYRRIMILENDSKGVRKISSQTTNQPKKKKLGMKPKSTMKNNRK